MLENILIVDVLTLLVSIGLLLRYGRLTHAHPAVIYLVFHVLTFTTRLVSLALGAPTLFGDARSTFRIVTHEEIARAILLADAALLAMTMVWLYAAARQRKPVRSRTAQNSLWPRAEQQVRERKPMMLSMRNVWGVIFVCFPIGLVALRTLPFLPGISSGFEPDQAPAASFSIGMTQVWVGLCLLALIYCYGLQWKWVVPMVAFLLVISLQGYSRYRLIIPVILMIQIYLDRRGMRWPDKKLVGLLVALLFVFIPLKAVGRMVQAGVPADQIFETAGEQIALTITGDRQGDQTLLDQYASTLTLVDEAGRFYYGSTYLPLLTLAIPRSMWPDKPDLNEYQGEISTPVRPMKQMGMITTILGELYANAGYLGAVLVMCLLAHGWVAFYNYAYQSGYLSVAHFAYLLLACNAIQVFRDGLISIVMFTVVNMFPLTLIVVLHYFHKLIPKQRGPRGSLRTAAGFYGQAPGRSDFPQTANKRGMR